jgi:hypothetical protein
MTHECHSARSHKWFNLRLTFVTLFSIFRYRRQSIFYLTNAISIFCCDIDIMRYAISIFCCDIDIDAIWISHDDAISILCDIDILMRYIDIEAYRYRYRDMTIWQPRAQEAVKGTQWCIVGIECTALTSRTNYSRLQSRITVKVGQQSGEESKTDQ